MTIGIYKITEKSTGRCYIGQSKDIEGRWKGHYKRFSISDFDYAIIRTTKNVKFLNAFEKYYISFYDSHRNGFNKTIGGTDIKSTHPDEETRRKLSEAAKNISNETRRKLSEARRRRKNSDETRRKISETCKGKKHTDEAKRKISKANKNPSVETRRKKSEAAKNRQEIVCPHCQKVGTVLNLMNKWHFNNCKFYPSSGTDTISSGAQS